jgi:alkylation response protein AidB-like acyl-CoA dehydrogenase
VSLSTQSQRPTAGTGTAGTGTAGTGTAGTSTAGTTDADRAARPFDRAAFRAFLDRLRPGARDREARHRLLFDEVRELQGLGFGALRLPREHGGGGASLEELFGLLVDLAAADSNLGHLVRGHVAFVETLLLTGLRPGQEPDASQRRWVERLRRGDLVGNAQSERRELGDLGTRLERGEDGGWRVTGAKYYTTGSIYADWIHLAALDGDERVGVTLDAHQPGVRSVDDWDGFGQPLTGSGTTTFEAVPVDPEDITRHEPDDETWPYLGAVFQLVLLATVAGVAQAALDDTVEYTRGRRRTFGHAGEHAPREDPLVQAVVGRLSAAAHAARAIVLHNARALDAFVDAVRDGRAAQGAARSVQLDVFRAQQVVLPLVLEATSELFEVGGASATSTARGLDRHWRNVRTVASHNPAVQRAAAIGQFELDGTLPEWRAAAAPAARTAGTAAGEAR